MRPGVELALHAHRPVVERVLQDVVDGRDADALRRRVRAALREREAPVVARHLRERREGVAAGRRQTEQLAHHLRHRLVDDDDGVVG